VRGCEGDGSHHISLCVAGAPLNKSEGGTSTMTAVTQIFNLYPEEPLNTNSWSVCQGIWWPLC
jgi:hypothetical protein